MKNISFIIYIFMISIAPSADDELYTFEKHILPVLEARCAVCHNAENPMANLNLLDAQAIAKGSLHGHVIVREHADESLLWQKIMNNEMPPDAPLPESEKLLIQTWIQQGAQGLPEPAVLERENHWAFQPLQMPSIPNASDNVPQSIIDRFIAAKLLERGLSMNPEADRLTLIRRVSFDLTGLPPTPEDLSLYITDTNDGAYQRMVERYLSSPHYGEHWAQYWLDAAGYADSNGYFHADTDRPLAYKYRDYVIRSLNEDKPYNQFVMEQLAGDELAGYKPGGDITPEMVDLLTATHFLRNAQDGTGESDGNPVERQTDRITVLEGTVDITASSLLGLTMRCAKCHDHKFDPITQKEYFSMQALFIPAYAADAVHWLKPNERVVEVGTIEERKQYHDKVDWIERQIEPLKESKSAYIKTSKEQLIQHRIDELPLEIQTPLREALDATEENRSEEQKQVINENKNTTVMNQKDLEEFYPSYQDVISNLDAKIESFEKQRPEPLEQISILFNIDAPPLEHQIFIRGDHTNRGKVVEPDVPQALCKNGNDYPLEKNKAANQYGRRTAFAKWVTSKENPLTARVMANRIWQHHFQNGIVATQGNFGVSGAKPTHPELLDYLAVSFMKNHWSIKNLHREILYSAAYRQSTAMNEEAYKVDPSNTLLWRYPLKRLTAEQLRDAMLMVSGELDTTMYGPYIPVQFDDGKQIIADENHPGRFRRSIYLRHRRTEMPSMLELFDSPSVVTSVQTRSSSTVALQPLLMLNSYFALDRAEALAKRIEKDAADYDDQKVTTLFLLAVGRAPNPQELHSSLAFLRNQKTVYAEQNDLPHFALRDLCQMVMAGNAFLYLN